MRICIDISQIVYEGTGSGRYVRELVSALLAQDNSDEYVLFGSAWKRKDSLVLFGRELRKRYPHRKIVQKYFSFPPAFFELFWNKVHILSIEWFVGRCDVYHSSDWVEAPSRQVKVTTVHDLIPFLYPEHVHQRIKKAHTMRWKWIREESQAIIVDAEVTKKDIVKLFSVDPERIFVVPLACSETFFSLGKMKLAGENSEEFLAHSKQVLDSYNLLSGRYILAVGTLEPRKNISRLIEAYGALDESLRQDKPLIAVGKKAWGEQFHVSGDVRFTGYVAEEDLPYLYAHAYCFVMPSLYEGFGLPVLEAMASGTPVLCTNRSSLPEIGGSDVHYIEAPENTLGIRAMLEHMLRSDPNELKQVAAAAFERAKQFSWKTTAEETWQIYQKVYNR